MKTEFLVLEIKVEEGDFRSPITVGNDLEVIKFDEPNTESRTVLFYGRVNRIFTRHICYKQKKSWKI